MNKVICDICGTSYPETSEQCPICGYSRDSHIEPLAEGEEFLLDEALDFEDDAAQAAIFTESDIAQSVSDELDTDDVDANDDSEEEVEEKRRPSALLIVLLVLVIIALLGVAGFIFVKYYLPGMRGEDPVPETTAAVVETTEATIPTVPCTSLVMTSDGEVTLEQLGNNWLINIVAMPENTTDEVIYTSSDESVAVVDASGKVTAVGEGQAVITVTCGEYQLSCDVICAFVPETSVPDVTEVPTEAPTEAATETPTEAPTEGATEAPTEAPTEPADDFVLKLNKTDISFDRVGVYYTLKVNDDIDSTKVEWITSHGGVCVVKDGVVTITGPGMAKVTAKYKGQEASCIIRVSLGGSTSGE